MHFGLQTLGNDDDVLNLAQYVNDHKLIRVYTEHVNEATLALSTSPEYNKKMDFIKDKPLSSCIKKLAMDSVCVVKIGENKDDATNDIDQGFNEFDEEVNEFDLRLYQHILQSNFAVNEQNVDDKVHEGEDNAVNVFHEGEDNAVNMEVTKEFNEMNGFNEFNEMNEINDENVDMIDFVVDDGIEDNIETDEENHERSDGSEDSDDSEFWVDEDNIIPDAEVDMRDFYMNIDLEA
ncbi:unnamed protein product [Lactuca saligna]|uniref:Uncharacterized protein n=1 Tax=Lactuca saligna TaxID=75948 RepID=A0AA36A0H5_LACSI|nr:unnamed protein product [Lactuca saligna]